MRHLLILCCAVATVSSTATARAQRTLNEEQSSSLLQYLPAYFASSEVWQVMRVEEAYDWQPPSTLNAYVLFRAQSAGAGECLAPVFAFAGVSDARGATRWQVASDVAAQHSFWAERQSCANVALDDGVLLRRAMLEVGGCGWLGVEFHLDGNATEIIDASWVVE
jgi:hypothetical protein